MLFWFIAGSRATRPTGLFGDRSAGILWSYVRLESGTCLTFQQATDHLEVMVQRWFGVEKEARPKCTLVGRRDSIEETVDPRVDQSHCAHGTWLKRDKGVAPTAKVMVQPLICLSFTPQNVACRRLFRSHRVPPPTPFSSRPNGHTLCQQTFGTH